jgi:hypothetical protein
MYHNMNIKMDNMTITYELYLINNNVYINYDFKKFNDIQFENKINLIRLGYEKTSDDTDYYLIDINNKICKSSLHSYPKFIITLNLLKSRLNCRSFCNTHIC